MLELKKITKIININGDKYDIFTNFSLMLNAVGLYYITGRNGSGKTTLFNILSGFSEYCGEIRINGELCDKKELQNKVEYSFQNNLFFDDRTLMDNITMILKLKGNSVSLENIEQLMLALGLFEFKDKCVQNLSGGEKRKTAFLISALSQKKIIIFDEPLSGVDNYYRGIICQIMEELALKNLIIVANHEEVVFKNAQIIEIENRNFINLELEERIIDAKISKKTFILAFKQIWKPKALFIFIIFFALIFTLLGFNTSIIFCKTKTANLLEVGKHLDYIISFDETKEAIEDSPNNLVKQFVFPLGNFIDDYFLLQEENLPPSQIHCRWDLKMIERFTLVEGKHPKPNNIYKEVLVVETWAQEFKAKLKDNNSLFDNTFTIGKLTYKIVGIIKNPLSSSLTDELKKNTNYYSLDEHFLGSFYALDEEDSSEEKLGNIYFMNNENDRYIINQLSVDKKIYHPVFMNIYGNYIYLENVADGRIIFFSLLIVIIILLSLIYGEFILRLRYKNIYPLYLFGTSKKTLIIAYLSMGFSKFLGAFVLSIYPIFRLIRKFNQENFKYSIFKSMLFVRLEMKTFFTLFLCLYLFLSLYLIIRLLMVLVKEKAEILKEIMK